MLTVTCVVMRKGKLDEKSLAESMSYHPLAILTEIRVIPRKLQLKFSRVLYEKFIKMKPNKIQYIAPRDGIMVLITPFLIKF